MPTKLNEPPTQPCGGISWHRGNRWHVLRRTHSTWLKNVGAAPGVIQHQLGHTDPHLAFELYVLSVPGERRKAVERVSTQLQRLLDPNSTHRPRRSDLMMFYFQWFVRSETWVTLFGPKGAERRCHGRSVLLPMSPERTFDNWSGREDLNLRPPGPEL